MIDPYLLEAMREVDAMLPDTPPIAPSEEPYEKANRVFVEWAATELGRRGIERNSGAALLLERAMRNAANDYDHSIGYGIMNAAQANRLLP